MSGTCPHGVSLLLQCGECDQIPSLIQLAREACQDHGARRFIGNNADAGVLGSCGLEAVRVVLEALLDYSGPYRYNQVELSAEEVERLLEEVRRSV